MILILLHIWMGVILKDKSHQGHMIPHKKYDSITCDHFNFNPRSMILWSLSDSSFMIPHYVGILYTFCFKLHFNYGKFSTF